MGLNVSKIDGEERLRTLLINYIIENMENFSQEQQKIASNYRDNCITRFYSDKNINDHQSDLNQFAEHVKAKGVKNIVVQKYYEQHLHTTIFGNELNSYDYKIHVALINLLENTVIDTIYV